MYQIVIIGTGIAGYTLAREIRRIDTEKTILLITSDDGVNYSKPMLSNALGQNKTPEQLAMSDADAMADTLKAEIRTHTIVQSIDTAARQIQTQNETIEYENLILAVGAAPVHIPVDGDGAQDVLSVNTLTDYRVFREKLQNAQTVAISGPGLIGCEFANDLLNADKKVHVIGPDKYALSSLLPEAIGLELQTKLQQAGVQWHLQTTVSKIDKNEASYQVSLNNDEQLEVDLVLSAAGLRPDVHLAKQAGLEVNVGIVADDYLQTSANNVYALGDCVEANGQNLLYIMPLMNGAKALAKTLTGEPTKINYPIMPVAVKTPIYPLTVLLPAPQAKGQWQIEKTENSLEARFESETGQMQGFILAQEAVKKRMTYIKQLG
ncbi:FAD-dependent oxidoreductase [Candidatus Albibeggiatoa sp. nov. NOAA]|uniref:FAD-dependent oxidoreductase n=1 Tax=Candidatus Albibeggiatoa sp. nov. NOAA TaxID=3162724 RepID=UPI0032F69FF0|nr:FAD-dependent oxidoreductase [Thiotrichaceae bacterium]